jgi:hypothetical protein
VAKKMAATPRVTQRTAETDVVTRGPADDIRHCAYRLFQDRGSEHGHDVEDWFLAEAELLEGHSTAVAAL